MVNRTVLLIFYKQFANTFYIFSIHSTCILKCTHDDSNYLPYCWVFIGLPGIPTVDNWTFWYPYLIIIFYYNISQILVRWQLTPVTNQQTRPNDVTTLLTIRTYFSNRLVCQMRIPSHVNRCYTVTGYDGPSSQSKILMHTKTTTIRWVMQFHNRVTYSNHTEVTHTVTTLRWLTQ